MLLQKLFTIFKDRKYQGLGHLLTIAFVPAIVVTFGVSTSPWPGIILVMVALFFIFLLWKRKNPHEKYMQHALKLAQKGIGKTAPNPLVGAVFVYKGKIVSEGFHEFYGGPHAEVNALKEVTDNHVLSTGTLYVTLEPCVHFGKTPPCTDLIISKGIRKVVIGSPDVFEQVNGRGIETLKGEGIEVITGVLSESCREINRRFFAFHEKKRPYVILKWAQTEDGFIDKLRPSGEKGSFPISGEETATLVHQWRSEEAAILVGTKTALTDNPSLTVRLVSSKNPVRVVIDKSAKIPVDYRIFDTAAQTLVFGKSTNPAAEVIPFDDTKDLSYILDELYRRNIQSLFVEGGATLLQAFIDGGLWDEARIITAPSKLENGLKAPLIKGDIYQKFTAGKDQITILRNYA